MSDPAAARSDGRAAHVLMEMLTATGLDAVDRLPGRQGDHGGPSRGCSPDSAVLVFRGVARARREHAAAGACCARIPPGGASHSPGACGAAPSQPFTEAATASEVRP